MANENTEKSAVWRAEQKRLGRIPKLVWIHPLDWPRLQGLIKHLKKRRDSAGEAK